MHLGGSYLRFRTGRFAVEAREECLQSLAFIDLFAGLRGIRLPIDELGYRRVFSSEWDAAARRTYMRNLGEIPMLQDGKIARQRGEPKPMGFPCP